jgi:hypothetical protein
VLSFLRRCSQILFLFGWIVCTNETCQINKGQKLFIQATWSQIGIQQNQYRKLQAISMWIYFIEERYIWNGNVVKIWDMQWYMCEVYQLLIANWCILWSIQHHSNLIFYNLPDFSRDVCACLVIDKASQEGIHGLCTLILGVITPPDPNRPAVDPPPCSRCHAFASTWPVVCFSSSLLPRSAWLGDRFSQAWHTPTVNTEENPRGY